MKKDTLNTTRRGFLAASVGAGAGMVCARALRADEKQDQPAKAQIAITLDLEMSRNFPAWEETRWDYEKGNLNDETKRYTVEACRRDPAVPWVSLGTAHPAKFPDAVEAAIGIRPALPERLADLLTRPERVAVLPNDLGAVQAHVAARAARQEVLA